MKPENHQEQQLVGERPNATLALQLLATTQQCQAEHPEETTDSFEAILEAYARDPERWDGLE
jgi:hypothetical protein